VKPFERNMGVGMTRRGGCFLSTPSSKGRRVVPIKKKKEEEALGEEKKPSHSAISGDHPRL